VLDPRNLTRSSRISGPPWNVCIPRHDPKEDCAEVGSSRGNPESGYPRFQAAPDAGVGSGQGQDPSSPPDSALIAQNWDDLLRVAGSLKLGRLTASELLRSLQTGGRPVALVRALAELGRVAYSRHPSKQLYISK
jgi:Tn3 transposase DDE domain